VKKGKSWSPKEKKFGGGTSPEGRYVSLLELVRKSQKKENPEKTASLNAERKKLTLFEKKLLAFLFDISQ